MKPGDSLVDKIFEEGLKEARAVVIVLSEASVQKPWVREELNASVVNRISRGTRLIPVVIDNCHVPEALQSTIWQKIEDLDDYGESLQRILSVIFDVTDKPAIGAPPARFAGPAPLIEGLARLDDLVLRVIARMQIDEGASLVKWECLQADSALQDAPQQELLDSLEILEQHYFVKVGKVIGAPLSHVVLTDLGFLKFAEAYVDDYQGAVNRIAALLMNEEVRQNQELAARVNKPVPFVDFVLSLMETNNYIKVSKYLGGQSHVWEVSASLRRALQES